MSVSMIHVFQSAYMHTAISDPAILVVFELVAKLSDEDGDGITSDVGYGWGFISLFSRKVSSIDVSDSAASPATRYILLIHITSLLWSTMCYTATLVCK